jgi:hypothetical protein
MRKKTDPVALMRDMNELLERLLIANLALAHVPRQKIRKIVGCEMNKVTRIASAVKVKSRRNEAGRGGST